MKDLYDEICFLLTDYENAKEISLINESIDWEGKFYQMLVKVQNAMDMEVNE